MPDSQPFDQWAVLEIMGHVRLAGRVREQSVAGTGFLRIDVPETVGLPAFTRLYGTNTIYSITPVSEEFARQAAAALRETPVNVYVPALHPPQPSLFHGEQYDDDDE